MMRYLTRIIIVYISRRNSSPGRGRGFRVQKTQRGRAVNIISSYIISNFIPISLNIKQQTFIKTQHDTEDAEQKAKKA